MEFFPLPSTAEQPRRVCGFLRDSIPSILITVTVMLIAIACGPSPLGNDRRGLWKLLPAGVG
jgi:hypothetical protein